MVTMIMKKFINRKKELQSLENMLESNEPGIIVIYGRRRVGKTRLVLEALKNKNGFYYLATESKNVDGFSRMVNERFPEFASYKKDWEVLLEKLDNKIDVLVLDEFPNMISEDKGILSQIQRVLDTRIKHMKLALTGSTISTMTSKVLSYKSPLYGRRIGDLNLKPMSFFDAAKFFPNKDITELMEIFGFADGIPFYLEKISGNFWEWLDKELRNPGSFIKSEGDFLLKYEFEETSVYKAILEAIAYGKTRRKDISDHIGIRGDIGSYLKNLMELGFIRREIPVTERRARSRNGRYYLNDNFLRFWFRFIHPNVSYIEMGTFRSDDIKREYSHYMGYTFETIAKQYLVKKVIDGKIERMNIGRWWHKDTEIDIVGIGEKKALYGEVKWKDNVDPVRIARRLDEKVKKVRVSLPYEMWIFAKSFKRKMSQLDGIRVKCVDASEIKRQIK